jgi:hypothetical protein
VALANQVFSFRDDCETINTEVEFMSHSQRSLLTVRSGILIFLLVLVGSIYASLSNLPDMEIGPLVVMLAMGILPAAIVFIALGIDWTGDDQTSKV